MLKRALLIAAVVAVAVAGVIALRNYRFALTMMHPPREAVPPAPALEGLRAVEFTEATGTVLRGWWVPSKNHAVVILCHGFAANRAQMSVELGLLARHGYGALAYDFPGHGSSGGDLVTWGDHEQASLRAAIDFVDAQAGVDPQRVGALGFSMGASTVIEVAAEDPRLKAIAATGAFTSLGDELDFDAGKWGPLSRLPARFAMQRAGVNFDHVRPVKVVCKLAPRPLLLIHGGDDTSSPMVWGRRLFDAACEPKSFWLVPGAHHGDYGAVDLPGYEQRLFALFDGALLK